MFYNFKDTATQKRTGSYSSNRASVASTGASFVGQFTSLDPKMAVLFNVIGQGYLFNAPGGSDIRAGDVLTINSVDYKVQGVQRFTQASIDILRCALILTETA